MLFKTKLLLIAIAIGTLNVDAKGTTSNHPYEGRDDGPDGGPTDGNTTGGGSTTTKIKNKAIPRPGTACTKKVTFPIKVSVIILSNRMKDIVVTEDFSSKNI